MNVFKYFLLETETGPPKGPPIKGVNYIKNRRIEVYRAESFAKPTGVDFISPGSKIKVSDYCLAQYFLLHHYASLFKTTLVSGQRHALQSESRSFMNSCQRLRLCATRTIISMCAQIPQRKPPAVSQLNFAVC